MWSERGWRTEGQGSRGLLGISRENWLSPVRRSRSVGADDAQGGGTRESKGDGAKERRHQYQQQQHQYQYQQYQQPLGRDAKEWMDGNEGVATIPAPIGSKGRGGDNWGENERRQDARYGGDQRGRDWD